MGASRARYAKGALQLRAEYRNGIHELIAPDFFPIETAHAITRAERQRRILHGSGWGLWENHVGLPRNVPVESSYATRFRSLLQNVYRRL
jgi:hypothetical protein